MVPQAENFVRESWRVKDGAAELYRGDSLGIIPTLPQVDAIITDPPYSSGGLFRSDRALDTGSKYTLTGTQRQFANFDGDNRDQRSWITWTSLWLAQCLAVCRPGAPLFCFCDWRQLPAMTDAIQAGGFIWRGIVPWNKCECSRPQRGWFRAQCEYILTATAGNMPQEQKREVAVCLAGFMTMPVNIPEKIHATQKPVELMEWILKVIPRGATVLDPFAGSGTTGVACIRSGYRFIGIEANETHYQNAKSRLEQELACILPFSDQETEREQDEADRIEDENEDPSHAQD